MANDKRPRTSESVEKSLPENLDAERYILGAVLQDNAALAIIAKQISSVEFSYTGHQVIFRHMLRMGDAGAPIEIVTLVDSLTEERVLETAGGAAYIASLASGLLKVSNVEHYCKIVREKEQLRSIIRHADDWQRQAWDREANSTEILSDLSEFVKMSGNGHGGNPLVAIDLKEFLQMKLDPVRFLIEPILPVGNSAMMFSPTGAGKTYIMLYMAYCVSVGRSDCFVWNVPSRSPVVYVDGEMDAATMQERLTEVARGFMDEGVPDKDYFKLITPDLQPRYPPRINTKEGRARIEEHLKPGSLLVADNLVTLCPGADDKETDDWAVTQEWILYLRRNGIGVFIVQHAGKSGDQLGTSKKEIQLSCNLKLRTFSDHTQEDGLRVQVDVKKLRRRGLNGRWEPRWGLPFEITLRVDAGTATFSHRPMLDILRKRAVKYLVAGMHPTDVVTETGLSRFTVLRLKKKITTDGIVAAETSEE